MATIKVNEEAVKKIAERVYDNGSTVINRNDLEEMFPAFKESEGEGIRKALTELVHDTTGDSLWVDYNVHKEDALAWLEKQGEKPQRILSAEAKEAMYDKPAPVMTGPIGFDGEPMESKPCEQKLAESINDAYPETLDKAIDLYYYSYGNGNGYFENLSFEKFKDIVKTFVSDYSKQKPAWSKDDEYYYGIIQYCLNNEIVGKADKENAISWFQSLKERVPSKKEWSKEDEQLYNDLSDTYYYNDEDYPEETYKLMLKRVLDWMTKRAKSLKPQSQWKPSDEQMDNK